MSALGAVPRTAAGARARMIPPAARELGMLAAVTVLLFLVPYVASTYVLEVGYLILQLAALATAWNLLAGYTGMVSLGSAAFVGIGIYAVAELENHGAWPLPLAFAAAGLTAAVFAVAVSPAMFRLRGLYFTIGTLALAEALRLWMVNSSVFGGASGIFLQTRAPAAYVLYWMALGAAVLATAVVIVVLRRPLALRLHAVRDDEDVARQMGVFTFPAKLTAFAVSAFIMGVVGGIQALNLGVVEPYGSFGLSWTVDIVMVAIIGGLATRTGPWAGAVFTVLLGELLKAHADLHLAISGAILLIVIRFAPRGISGTLGPAIARMLPARRGGAR
jgi:branched-chain amino acid transport system permease protein